MSDPFRILITGSRDWTDYPAIYRALIKACDENGLNYEPDEYGNTMPDPSKITVVEGGCPTGADFIADQWCVGNMFVPEVHKADWDRFGKSAGFIRNKHMVSLGADLCLAFILRCTRCSTKAEGRGPHEPHSGVLMTHGSHGATHTALLAEEAGIPTVRYER